MARKTAARGRQRTEGRTSRPASRATRTRRKTARASGTAPGTKLGRQTAAARRDTHVLEHEHRVHDGETDQGTLAHAEDDEEMDWLGEDEDPRRQIVEDEDDADPRHEEEW